MAIVAANLRIRLQPSRRRFAKSVVRIIEICIASDYKLYASGRAFLPIFPKDDGALQAALQTVYDQAKLVLNPQPLNPG